MSTTTWLTLDGQGWELTYTGPAPDQNDIAAVRTEANLNQLSGLGAEATVTFVDPDGTPRRVTLSALHTSGRA